MKKKPWSKQEVCAAMKHFKSHITRGRSATVLECKQCKLAEDPVLRQRSVQNLRDFVRNNGRKKLVWKYRPV